MGSVPFRYGVLLLGRYAIIFAPRNVFRHVKIVPLVGSCKRPLFCYVMLCYAILSYLEDIFRPFSKCYVMSFPWEVGTRCAKTDIQTQVVRGCPKRSAVVGEGGEWGDSLE